MHDHTAQASKQASKQALVKSLQKSSFAPAFSAVLLLSVLGLAGCASQSQPVASPDAPQVALHLKQPLPRKFASINLTPYTSYTDNWSLNNDKLERDSLKLGGDSLDRLGGDFSDSYTRLLITSDLRADGNNNSDGKIAEYPYKPRSGLARWIYGKEFSVNFSAKVKVDGLEETIPLVTIGHESNSDGEKWSRVVSHADRNHPLFLVKGNGNGAVPKITVTMHGSMSYASRGAANALQIVFGAVNAVSPNSPVATPLNSQASKDRANALDTAISKLFGTAVKEEHTTTPDFRLWNKSNGQPNGIDVTLYIPSGESWSDSKNKDDAQDEKNQIGVWTITFDYPRPSIFSDWRICGATHNSMRCKANKDEAKQQILNEINANEVLNYILLNDGQKPSTVRTYLAQQEWFIQAQTKLVAANAKQANTKELPIKNAANQMCRNIRSSITELNLNSFDADIVVWAVMEGLPWADGTPDYKEMEAIDGCNAIALAKQLPSKH